MNLRLPLYNTDIAAILTFGMDMFIRSWQCCRMVSEKFSQFNDANWLWFHAVTSLANHVKMANVLICALVIPTNQQQLKSMSLTGYLSIIVYYLFIFRCSISQVSILTDLIICLLQNKKWCGKFV